MSKVILELGKNRRAMAYRIMDGLSDEMLRKIKDANTVFIKPNLIHHERSLATTHIDGVRGVLDFITEHSRAHVIIGDGSMMGTAAAFRHFGYEQLMDEYEKVELIDLNDDDWEIGGMIREDGGKSEMRMSLTAAKADVKISLSPLKTHASVGLSGVIENWVFGTWIVPPRISPFGRIWARWPWLESQGVKAHHASIVQRYTEHPFHIGIIDAVMPMQGDGPIEGEAIELGTMFGGEDPLSVDAVAATVMGIDPHEIAYLQMLHDDNRGTIDMTRIDIPPAALESIRRTFLMPVGLPERLREAKE